MEIIFKIFYCQYNIDWYRLKKIGNLVQCELLELADTNKIVEIVQHIATVNFSHVLFNQKYKPLLGHRHFLEVDFSEKYLSKGINLRWE
ncbi:CLUMA_CG013916, isoform A [Clunio marinus]|uniref:CLUMA_CG013916, isoform A n=1 Tax=Clunio marinus TaxID=568069 RepID=A0A1J1IKF2_9DIPT|nr:CLUMA_CG013916, isoform A [Clunio marinus]